MHYTMYGLLAVFFGVVGFLTALKGKLLLSWICAFFAIVSGVAGVMQVVG